MTDRATDAPTGIRKAPATAGNEVEFRVAADQAAAERDFAVAELDRIYQSTSWRLTAPVRSLARFAQAYRPDLPAAFWGYRRSFRRACIALRQAPLMDQARRLIALTRINEQEGRKTATDHPAREAGPDNQMSVANLRAEGHASVITPSQSDRDLDACYALSEENWDNFLAKQLWHRSRVAAAADASGRTAPDIRSRCCWLLVAAADDDVERIGETLRSAAELSARARFGIGVVVIAPTPVPALQQLIAAANRLRGRLARTLRDAVADIAPTDQLVFLRAGDRLRREFASAALSHRMFERRLTLLDLYRRSGGVVYPLLLPGVNLCHALNCDYFRSRFVARADAVREVLDASRQTPYQIALRIMSNAYAERRDWVAHVDLPLIEIAEPANTLASERARLIADSVEAVFPSADGCSISAAETDATALGKVSVVICTKDKGILLRQIVNSLLNKQSRLLAGIVVVSNRTSNQRALRGLADLRGRDGVTVIDYDAPFNFSAQSNLGARYCTGEFLLFLNDDIVPASDDWLEKLLLPFANPRAGITAPLLVYPDETVQHAGMYLGHNNLAGHTLRHALLPDQDYMFMATAPRFVSVVTGACLLMRRQVFKQLDGFDAAFATYIQDVDLCLRAGQLGYDIVFNPQAVLIHMESPSVKSLMKDKVFHEVRIREAQLFRQRWHGVDFGDRYHNANFSSDDETLHRLS